ncbi:MAG: DUF72 domain-containing protein [Cyanobacteria bacterium P01_G01_bin.54]
MDLKSRFYLGCAVWAYADWVGSFYPSPTSSRNFLRCYGDRLNTVEGNSCFYAVPPVKTVERWRAQTPAGFKFCPKFPQTVTHQGLLLPQLPGALSFIERMQHLDNRLGVLFLQLPPRYGPEQAEDLLALLRALPRTQVEIALEVRHPHWFYPQMRQQLNADLAQLGVHRVILDTRSIYSSPGDPQAASRNHKPQLPVFPDSSTETVLIRFISHPNPQYHEPFLSEWLAQIKDWLAGDRTVYFFVHCPAEVHSPQTARVVYQRLQTMMAGLPELFSPPTPSSKQLRLF